MTGAADARPTVHGERTRWVIGEGRGDIVAHLEALDSVGLGGWRALDDGRTVERAHAPSLSTWLRGQGGRVDWRAAATIARDLARGLAWCETHDRFFGALAPDAVVVSPEGRATWLADGLLESLLAVAPLIAARSDAGQGTRWMPPEQAMGGGWDHAANRYVLGLMLYRMLAGSHPFGGRGLRRALEEQSSRGAPPLDEAIAATLPGGFQGFVLRLLDPDAQARPRHAAAIVERLERWLTEESIAAAPVVTAPPQAVVTHATAPTMASHGTQPSAVSWSPAPLPIAAPPANVVRVMPKPASRGIAGPMRWLLAGAAIAGGVAMGRQLLPTERPIVSAVVRTGERPALSAAQTSADDCATCHPEHAAQWHGSVMAHSVKSPLFQALEILIQEQGGRDASCAHGAGLLRPSDGRTSCRSPQGFEITGSGGALWCVSCHAPASNLERDAVPAWNGFAASSVSRRPLRDILSPAAMEGISCAFCHQVQGPVRPGAAQRGEYEGNPDWTSFDTNVRFASRPEDLQGLFGIANSGYSLDPRELLLGAGASTPVPTGAHGRPSTDARAYLESSEFCGSCHDVRLFGTDAINRGESFKRLRNAYSEWRDWADDERGAGREPASCQDCHMSTFPGICAPVADADATLGQLAAGATALARACPPGTSFAARAPGIAATGAQATASAGPGSVAPHYFTGVDIPLSPEFPSALVDDPTLDAFGIPKGAKQRRDLLLGRTFRFEINDARRAGDRVEIPVVLENVGAGHRVPAGFSQEREFWVHLVVRGADGRILYEVGRVDRNDEDLRDKTFLSVNTSEDIVDNQGRPLGMFGADIVDGPDVPAWDPDPLTGATRMRGRGLANLQNGFLRCVTCDGIVDASGRCQPDFARGQGRHRADRFNDGEYIADTGECRSNLSGPDAFFETYFPVGALDATRGVAKAPDAIIDTRSAPPGQPLEFTYDLDVGRERGPIQVEARLLFRAFPPFLIRAFADYEAKLAAAGQRPSGPLVTHAMLDRLEVVELHRVRVTIP